MGLSYFLKTTIGISPYRILFGKPSCLLVELEYHTFWVVKTFDFDMKQAGSNYSHILNEFDKLHNEAYENAKNYKAKTKAFHSKIVSPRFLNLIRRFGFLIRSLNYFITS